MTLAFDPRAPSKRLDEALGGAIVSWAGFRSLLPLTARRRETIPIYDLVDAGRLAPIGSWYCRVEMDTETETYLLGLEVRLEKDRWRIDSIEEGDTLGSLIEWLDRNWSGLDSAVGLFREERLALTSLFVVERGEHILDHRTLTTHPGLPEGPIDTATLMAFIASRLEIDIVGLPEELASDPP